MPPHVYICSESVTSERQGKLNAGVDSVVRDRDPCPWTWLYGKLKPDMGYGKSEAFRADEGVKAVTDSGLTNCSH